jgi:hypothetical protein
MKEMMYLIKQAFDIKVQKKRKAERTVAIDITICVYVCLIHMLDDINMARQRQGTCI